MREACVQITTPPTDGRVASSDIDLASITLYTDGDPHLAWLTLRRDQPVFWNERPGGGGFWAVTRYADVRRVLRDHKDFTSERGTALSMIGVRDPAAGKMMHATDPPCHQHIRRPLEQPFAARQVSGYAPMARRLAHEALAPARDEATWDVAASLTRLPVAVMAKLMGLPDSDVDLLLRAAYASVAPDDPHYRRGSKHQTIQWSHATIVDYFTHLVRDRRRSQTSDVLAHLITMDVSGRVLTEEEAVLNCYSLLVGGVVTTAQAATTALIALTEQGGGEGRWPTTTPTSSLVEEALRWSSPAMHFMRYARRDVVIGNTKVTAGEPVTAWIISANRDETVFDRPYAFLPDRHPNRHIAFGTGAHRCVGRHLAKLVLRETFDELAATVKTFELVAPPVHLASNLIAGVIALPIRTNPRG